MKGRRRDTKTSATRNSGNVFVCVHTDNAGKVCPILQSGHDYLLAPKCKEAAGPVVPQGCLKATPLLTLILEAPSIRAHSSWNVRCVPRVFDSLLSPVPIPILHPSTGFPSPKRKFSAGHRSSRLPGERLRGKCRWVSRTSAGLSILSAPSASQ